MTAAAWIPADLLPHREPMILIDEVLDAGNDRATAAVRIGEDCLFFEPGRGVPVWVGIEYMAQTVALCAGIAAKAAGRPISVGLLLGTRKYACFAPHFPLGARLIVHAEQSWRDEAMAVFDCRIETDRRLAEAKLNVYMPRDFKAFLNGRER